jgi:hypothetical protein
VSAALDGPDNAGRDNTNAGDDGRAAEHAAALRDLYADGASELESADETLAREGAASVEETTKDATPDEAAAEEAEIAFVDVTPPDPKPRYCRRCQESHSFFTSPPWRCWKCGLTFDPRDDKTVLERRTPLRWKFWFPGFCLAAGVGMTVYALLLSASAPLHVALMGASPTCFGCLLGYGGDGRVRLFGLLLYFGGSAVLSMLAGGVLGVVLAILLLVPVGIGLLFGLVLRAILEGSRWDQRWYFP